MSTCVFFFSSTLIEIDCTVYVANICRTWKVEMSKYQHMSREGGKKNEKKTFRQLQPHRRKSMIHHPQLQSSIAPPILPSSPPPLLPKPAIKLLLPQLSIHLIMRLAHPPPKLRPTAQPRLITPTRMRHPRLEIIRAHPARVQPREQLEKPLHVPLLLRGCFLGVCRCH
jgi:hypothetical protein